jgi:hypothetical protein
VGFVLQTNPMTVGHIFSRADLLYTRLVLVLIMSSFLIGYVVMLYKLAAVLFPQQWATSLFAPIIGLAMIPACTWPQLYMYDPAVLCLTAACYYYLATQKWKHYLFWFFIAALNKETSMFLIFFFCIYFYKKLPHRDFFRYLVAQILIYGYIKVGIDFYYANNLGDTAENHFMQHIDLLFHSRYGLQDIFTVFVTLYLLLFRWQEKSVFIRYALFVIPVNYAAYFLFCLPGEYRDFFEIFPIIALLITDTLVTGTGIASTAFFNRPLHNGTLT